MSAETKKILDKTTEELINDIKDEVIVEKASEQKQEEVTLDEDKLAKLKAKLAAKETKTEDKKMNKKDRTLNIGAVGSGQAGSRLVQEMYRLGYDAVAINTAQQDLEFIDIPGSNKLLLDNSIGGSAKDLGLGKQMAEQYRDKIKELISRQLANSDVFMLCSSLGGGSGSGSLMTLIEILTELGKPIIVCCVLPLNSDDSQTKQNTLITLSNLAKMAQTKQIANLIVADNAKIESIYSNVSQLDFYDLSNKEIINPLDVFNKLSSMPSKLKGFDGMEYSRLLLDGEGLTCYGKMVISNYQEETALAEAIIENLDSNLLAELDIKKAKYCAFAMVANENVLRGISSASLNYAISILNEKCSAPVGLFRGTYVDNSIKEDAITIYSIFSGLDLPLNRIEGLKKEVAEYTNVIKNKDTQRNLSMNVDLGTDKVISKTEEIKERINKSKSTFNQFANSVVDRRKK